LSLPPHLTQANSSKSNVLLSYSAPTARGVFCFVGSVRVAAWGATFVSSALAWGSIDVPLVRAGLHGDGLDALALRIPQQPHRVESERALPTLALQHLANPLEVIFKPLNCGGIHEGLHSS
jgi:hypothetical protein